MYFWFYCIFILYILDIHSVMTLDMKTLLFYQIKFIYDVLSFVNFLFLFYSIFFQITSQMTKNQNFKVL